MCFPLRKQIKFMQFLSYSPTIYCKLSHIDVVLFLSAAMHHNSYLHSLCVCYCRRSSGLMRMRWRGRLKRRMKALTWTYHMTTSLKTSNGEQQVLLFICPCLRQGVLMTINLHLTQFPCICYHFFLYMIYIQIWCNLSTHAHLPLLCGIHCFFCPAILQAIVKFCILTKLHFIFQVTSCYSCICEFIYQLYQSPAKTFV